MMWRSWSDTVDALTEEIRAQAERFAQNHLARDGVPARITRIDHPELPGHLTFLIEQVGEPVVLIDVDADHVLEEAAKISARPGLIFEGIRRAARTIFIDPHLVGPLRRALARA